MLFPSPRAGGRYLDGCQSILGPHPSVAPPSPRRQALQAPPRCPLPHPQAPNKSLASILGKSNLRFAGMSIAISISVDGLNLSVPATRQVRPAACPQHPSTPGWAPKMPLACGAVAAFLGLVFVPGVHKALGLTPSTA